MDQVTSKCEETCSVKPSLQTFYNIREKLKQILEQYFDVYILFDNRVPKLKTILNSFYDYQNTELLYIIQDVAIKHSNFESKKCHCVNSKQFNLFRHIIVQSILSLYKLSYEIDEQYDHIGNKETFVLIDDIKVQLDSFCDYCSNFKSFKSRLVKILKLFDEDIPTDYKSNLEHWNLFFCDFIPMKDHWYKTMTENGIDMTRREMIRYKCIKYQSSLTPETIGTIITQEEHDDMAKREFIPEENYSITCNTCRKPYPHSPHPCGHAYHMDGIVFHHTKEPNGSQLEGLVYCFGYGSQFDSDMGQVLDKTLSCGNLCDACAVDLLEQGKLAVPTYNGM
jgi:hypothetical protein